MNQQAGRKALDGMRKGWDGLRAGGGRLAGRMGIGGAAAARSRAGLIALGAATAALALAGILLYLRKRRQVAAHYTMGEGEAAWEGGVARNLEDAGALRT